MNRNEIENPSRPKQASPYAAIAAALLAVALTGCATTSSYEGDIYTTAMDTSRIGEG